MQAGDPDRAGSRLDKVLGLMSAAPLALILVLTFADVLMRYILAQPVRGSSEIIQFAMALTIFAALPVVTRHREHISVSLTNNLFRGSMRTVRLLVCDGISLLGLALIAWRLGIQAFEYIDSKTATIVLGLGMAPLTFAMCAFAVLTCIVVVLQMIETLRGAPRAGAAS